MCPLNESGKSAPEQFVDRGYILHYDVIRYNRRTDRNSRARKTIRGGQMKSAALGTRGALCFAAGEVGANLTWNMISGFILFYYTNVVLLPAAAVGTMLLLTRVLDAVVDPMVGILVDKTRSRWGRARPYLIAGSVPFVIVTFLTFSVPLGSTSAMLIYAYITFTLAGMLFSLLYIPYNAMLPLITSDPAEKLRISSLRAIGASLGSIVMYSSMMYLVNTLGGHNQRLGFSITSAIMGTTTALSMLLVFRTTRERPLESANAQRQSLRVGLNGMIHNPIWLRVSALALLIFIRLGAMVSATVYFAIDVLRSPHAISWLFSSLSVSILIGGYIAKPLLAKLGLRLGNVLSIGLSIALTLGMALSIDHLWSFAVCYCLSNISIGVQSTTMFVMTADSVDYQEQLYGHRTEGMLTSALSFATKVGMAIGGSAVAFSLALVHYHPDAVTEAARHGITMVYFGVPVLIAIAQLLLMNAYRPASGSVPLQPAAGSA